MKTLLNKERISGPRVSTDALENMKKIADANGITVSTMFSQIGEACRDGKIRNWNKALAVFQDTIEK